MRLTPAEATFFALVKERTPNYGRLAYLLSRGAKMTRDDAQQHLKCCGRTAQYTLKNLYDDGLTHISGWKLKTRVYIPEYAWGMEKDAPYPETQRSRIRQPLTKAEKLRRKRRAELAKTEIFNVIVGKQHGRD